MQKAEILKNFKSKMDRWYEFKYIRSIIKDTFKLTKKSLDLHKIHRYTTKSITKHVSLNILLIGTIITLDYNSKTQLQTLAEN